MESTDKKLERLISLMCIGFSVSLGYSAGINNNKEHLLMSILFGLGAIICAGLLDKDKKDEKRMKKG